MEVQYSEGVKGLSPLLLAIISGSLPCVDYLLKKGATPASEDFLNLSPIHAAVYGGNADTLSYLVDRFDIFYPSLSFLSSLSLPPFLFCPHVLIYFWPRKNISAPDILGSTPLHKAAALGKAECLSILLSKNADVNKVGIL